MDLVFLIISTDIIQKPLGGVALSVSAGEKLRFNRKQKLSVKENCHGITFRSQAGELCHLTARQYGEVVLTDASTCHVPFTLAMELSRRKEGMARFLASWYKTSGLYECRGTMLIESWLVITLLLFY